MRATRGWAMGLLLAATANGAGAGPGGDAPGALHVASPDWRDQVIYFAMIDRFDDGDPSNNDQGVGEHDPARNAAYSGGDLRGLARRIDYIRGLGATALWITPPVANQWWNPGRSYSGYHGYWATDFRAVDAHYGTLADYQALSRALHGRGMYLVQDVVVNHVADYLGCTAAAADGDPATHCRVRGDAQGRSAPVRPPFDRNDPRDPAQRAAGIYHWTPDIVDFTDRRQELDFQLAGLDDLDTGTPEVRHALRDAYGYWIRAVGVDAFRVDTAFHVPAAYFADFLHAGDATAPGVLEVARQTGRERFLVFGEGFGTDRAFADVQARKLDGYMRTPGGIPAMLNFPLYGSLGDVFARGRPTAELGHRIGSTMALHAQPHLMPSFVDNHDVDRFLAGGNEAGLKQALLAILTLPGIPTLYYGTEQGFTEQRAAMFAQGFGSGGRDRFDSGAPLYRFLQRAIALRRAHPLFSRGIAEVLADNPAAPGALAWRMAHGDDVALVVFNSSERPALLDNLATGLAAGTRLQGLFAIDGAAPAQVVVGAGGRVSLVLPPRSGLVWRAGPVARQRPAPAAAITLEADGAQVRDDFVVHGTATGTTRVQVVVDGDLAGAIPVEVAADGRWQARIDTRDMVDPAAEHAVVAWDAGTGVASGRHRFRVAREWTLLADVADPAGDDTGPDGRYTYPADPGWRDHRQADLRGVRVWGSGGALKVQLRLRELTTPWNPANGFDHVAFTLFLELPGRDGGATVMPQQHATLPDGMRWHLRLRTHGWSNALFEAAGASASSEGTALATAAHIEVDRAAATVSFILPARALGNPATLSGAGLYVNTWDYDGGYRALAPAAQAHSFGGGEADGPRIMDASGVIRLP